jgi:PncC family amidohydrolase
MAACVTEGNQPMTNTGDLSELATQVGQRLVQRGETIAVAESSGGGLISSALLAVPGASRFFLGGAVVYTATAREALLGITPVDMDGLRSSSEPYARLLAERVRARLSASWGLAETGAAGPTGNRYGDPAGHTCLAVAGPSGSVISIRTGRSDRTENMRLFAAAALRQLLAALEPK